MTVKTSLGARLRAAREAAGLSQEQLEARSGVEQTTISKIERGASLRPSFAIVAALAAALGCSLDSLDDEHPSPSASEAPTNPEAA